MSWGRGEFERTCDECGSTWRVPKAIAKPKRTVPYRGNAATVGGIGAAIPGGGGLPSAIRDFDMINQVEHGLSSNAVAAQRAAEDLGRCPQCGSEEYSQRPFGR